MENTICKNCGAEYGLHHYQTNQCPVGGREAAIGEKQEWKTTVFEPEIVLPKEATVNVEQIRNLVHERNEILKALITVFRNPKYYSECASAWSIDQLQYPITKELKQKSNDYAAILKVIKMAKTQKL